MLSTSLSLTPVLIAVIVILGLRASALAGAAAGLTAAIVAAAVLPDAVLSAAALARAAQGGAIVTASAASVIIPGLLLNHELARRGVMTAAAEALRGLGLDPVRAALILLLGLFPALECLTGFGISLLLAVPVMMRLLGPAIGLPMALLGMHLMTWGMLALPTMIGAALAEMPAETLGLITPALQFPSLAVVALIGVGTIGGVPALRRYGLFAAALGTLQPILLHANVRFLLLESAGALSGLGIIAIGLGWEALRGRFRPRRADFAGLAGLLPFAAVLILLLIGRLVPPLAAWLRETWVFGSDRLSIAPLASPGIALLVVALYLAIRKPDGFRWRDPAMRAFRPIATVFGFVLLAQVMQETGLIALALHDLARLPFAAVVPLAPALGMLSGFTTGSGIAGNALFMTALYELGATHGYAYLFAAVQNAAAGQASFASLPIIALTLAIARDTGAGTALPTVQDLTRFALRSLLLIYAATASTFALLIAFP